MEILVRIRDGATGYRAHYCTSLQRFAELDVEGIRADASAHCPLCGALTTSERPDVRGGFVGKHAGFAGPRCEHGYLDLPCSEIAAAHPECELEFRTTVPEYRMWLIARERGAGPLVGRWVRPCAVCRRSFFERHAAPLELELRNVCRVLAAESRTAQSGVHRLQSELNFTHAVLEDATARPPELERKGVSMGYVYAITDGSAIKIGWTATHPAAPGGRLSQLQTAHAHELTLVGTLSAPVHHEGELHRRFSEHRIRGEWFRYVPAIIEYFDGR